MNAPTLMGLAFAAWGGAGILLVALIVELMT